uniref:Ankyrin repeat and SOCS box containing 18 n=1 Tax=Zosterops lateralis melanops TaxID=1220523 RepID=A0A8D2QQR8_ZOSLA
MQSPHDGRSLCFYTDNYILIFYHFIPMPSNYTKREKQSLELAGRQGWGCRAHPMPCPAGLWTLEERWELSTPLCLAARHGHPDCLRHLLRRGADPNLAPGGQAPLHWACQGGHSHCLELLLEYRADPNLRSDEGMAPLHLCTSPGSLRKRLVGGGGEGRAARGGGKAPGRDAGHGSCLPSREEGMLNICRVLLQIPPSIPGFLGDQGEPAWRGISLLQPRTSGTGLCEAKGWDKEVSPLWALLGAAAHRDRRPHVTVQLLLNHGSQRIWPPAFGKVLKSCATVPEVIEVLFNSYSQIPVSRQWAQAVPEEVFQQHQPFYQSVLGLAGRARCLQHLCRSAIRARLGGRCHSLIPLLPLPGALREFLLLEPQGLVL